MQDNFTKNLNLFQWLMYEKFKQTKEDSIDVILMLAVGHVFGAYTPNQLSELLGIAKSSLYEELSGWSIYQWRKMLMVIGCEIAIKEVKKVRGKSEATKSRMRITLSVDDTVIDRYGKILSLTYCWWSGRVKKQVKGQNIIGIVMKIGDLVIPVGLRPVSKQGRGNTTKPEIFEDMLKEIKEIFSKEGIDLTEYPISFDSWYGSKELVELLEDKGEGFSQILVHAKSNYVFTIDKARKTLKEHKKAIEFSEREWGCNGIPVARLKAENPTFGKLILLLFKQGGLTSAIMVFGRKLRSCEILNIWHQHNGIEQFWKSLKSILQIKRMSLRGREGCYAVIAIKLIAYLFMVLLAKKFHFSLYRFQTEARKYLDLISLVKEHFHVGRRLVRG